MVLRRSVKLRTLLLAVAALALAFSVARFGEWLLHSSTDTELAISLRREAKRWHRLATENPKLAPEYFRLADRYARSADRFERKVAKQRGGR